jgi:hypothetical protein
MPGDYEQGKEIGHLKAQVKGLEDNVDLIMTNHLPHIQAAIDEVKEKVHKIDLTLAKWLGGATVLWVIIQYVIENGLP